MQQHRKLETILRPNNLSSERNASHWNVSSFRKGNPSKGITSDSMKKVRCGGFRFLKKEGEMPKWLEDVTKAGDQLLWGKWILLAQTMSPFRTCVAFPLLIMLVSNLFMGFVYSIQQDLGQVVFPCQSSNFSLLPS
jgi:hypothetical protein